METEALQRAMRGEIRTREEIASQHIRKPLGSPGRLRVVASYSAMSMEHAREIERRAKQIQADLFRYRDPSRLDPSDLGEIEHAVRQLREICGESDDAQ